VSGEPALTVANLTLEYYADGHAVRAIADASLTVADGESVGLVGESGSGKSSLGRACMGLLPLVGSRITGGHILVQGTDAAHWTEDQWRKVRGHVVSIVFQDPLSYLNPVLTIGRQLTEAMPAEPRGAKSPSSIGDLLELVRLPRSVEAAYPHHLSGGMRQRVLIAMALASHPRVLIADEPTTALDVTVQADILTLLKDLQERLGMGLLLISHDLRVISGLCSRVYVMYGGYTVEVGPRKRVFASPQHPYTQGLLQAAVGARSADGHYSTIRGEPPDPTWKRAGCPFAPRCPRAMDICGREMPGWTDVGDGGSVRCWLVSDGRQDG
jgi:peptide/nickel transport system ATP-binding protein